jgi:hypothetical protein
MPPGDGAAGVSGAGGGAGTSGSGGGGGFAGSGGASDASTDAGSDAADSGDSSGYSCPGVPPISGDRCPLAGGPCVYKSGQTVCMCSPALAWICLDY